MIHAAKRIDIRLIGIGMLFFSDIHAGRNLCPNQGIQLFRIKILLPDHHRLHPAADIDTDHVWRDGICNAHRCTDRAAGTGVHIRHDADLAVSVNFHIADRL